MHSMPQKPQIPRPPAPPSTGGPRISERPLAKKPATSKMGLLGSLGFHACLIAAVCAYTLVNYDHDGSHGDASVPDGRELEFTAALKNPRPSQAEPVPKATLRHSPPLSMPPALLVGGSVPATMELPQPEPLQMVTSPQTAQPASASLASSPSPAAPSDGQPKKSASRKGQPSTRLVKPSARVAPPRLLQAPPPHYPAEAKAAGKSGKVAVLIQVRADGSAAATSVYHSSGSPLLDRAAVDAARAWTFSPTPSLAPGGTTPVVVQVTFTR